MDPVTVVMVACLVVGAVVGLLAGMLGIGGGLIIVPAISYLLVHVQHMDTALVMPIAVATSLATIIFTGASSALAHYRLGNLDRQLVSWCSAGIAVGATLGAQAASHMPGHLLKDIFAVLVILIAAQMIFGRTSASSYQAGKASLVGVGAGTGFFSALMGIGGGALLVPLLVWLQVNIRKAIGCAAFSGLVIAVFGTVSFVLAGLNRPGLPDWSVGYVYLPALAGIVVTSVFTASIGAKLGQRMDTGFLKKILAGLLVVVSIRMIAGIE